jgi:hypothetical protein
LHAPKQKVRQSLCWPVEVLRPAAVKPGWQQRRMMDELFHLAQQKLCQHERTFIARSMEGNANLIGQPALPFRADAYAEEAGRMLPRRHPQTFDNHNW